MYIILKSNEIGFISLAGFTYLNKHSHERHYLLYLNLYDISFSFNLRVMNVVLNDYVSRSFEINFKFDLRCFLR